MFSFTSLVFKSLTKSKSDFRSEALWISIILWMSVAFTLELRNLGKFGSTWKFSSEKIYKCLTKDLENLTLHEFFYKSFKILSQVSGGSFIKVICLLRVKHKWLETALILKKCKCILSEGISSAIWKLFGFTWEFSSEKITGVLLRN